MGLLFENMEWNKSKNESNPSYCAKDHCAKKICNCEKKPLCLQTETYDDEWVIVV